MSTRIKICGITTLDDARAAVELGADAVGFNFHPPSPRHLSPEAAAEIAAALPPDVCRVGVFVNEARERVATIARQVGLTAVQFHGDETPADCTGWSCKVIKAIRVRDEAAIAAATLYRVDYILADAFVDRVYGGSGERVDVDWLKRFPTQSLIVAGGLTADNVGALVREVRPFGVDVASGIERSPGRKDHELMRRFIENANAA
jgi:phosphoribosylanthranilate isomerase